MPRADNRIFKIVLLVIGVTLLGLHLKLGPPFHYASSFSAQVIDEESGEPVENVVVVVEWWLDGGFLHPRTRVLHVEEALTNGRGEFTIDGWWPRLRPPSYRAGSNAPRLTMYKRGYEIQQFSRSAKEGAWALSGPWDDRALPIHEHGNTRELYSEERESMRGVLWRLEGQKGKACCPVLSGALDE